jgi:hypothetical protein
LEFVGRVNASIVHLQCPSLPKPFPQSTSTSVPTHETADPSASCLSKLNGDVKEGGDPTHMDWRYDRGALIDVPLTARCDF